MYQIIFKGNILDVSKTTHLASSDYHAGPSWRHHRNSLASAKYRLGPSMLVWLAVRPLIDHYQVLGTRLVKYQAGTTNSPYSPGKTMGEALVAVQSE